LSGLSYPPIFGGRGRKGASPASVSTGGNREGRDGAYVLLFVVNFLTALGFSLLDPFLAIYAAGHGATGLSTALIFTGYSLSKALLSPLAGFWSQAASKRLVIAVGLVLYGMAALCLLFQPSIPILIGLRVVQGAAVAFIRPVSLAFVGDLVPVRREGALMGKFELSFYGAIAVGPALGGAVKDAAGFAGVFAVFFAVAAASLLAVALFWRNLSASDDPPAEDREPPARVWRSREFLAINGYIFTRIFGISVCAVFLPIFMTGSLRLSGAETGLVMASGAAVTVLLLVPMGRAADRIDRRLLIAAGGAACGLLTILLAFAPGFLSILAVAAAIGFFSVVTIPPTFALLVNLGRRYGTGVTMGIFNGVINAAFIVAPLAGGLIADQGGLWMVFPAAGIFGLAGTCFFLVLCKARDNEASAD
jgi:DHA1 family multidrug resistance protein-like MFS transporter